MPNVSVREPHLAVPRTERRTLTMDAQVTISGLVGTAVEFRPTPYNVPQATFRLGSTPRINRPGGWVDGKTNWITVVCKRILAENVAASINKGDAVLVQGKLRTWSLPDKNGELQDRLVIEATSVGHDLFRGTSTFQRVQRLDPPEDLDRETVEMIVKVEQQDLDDPFDVVEGREPAGAR